MVKYFAQMKNWSKDREKIFIIHILTRIKANSKCDSVWPLSNYTLMAVMMQVLLLETRLWGDTVFTHHCGVCHPSLSFFSTLEFHREKSWCAISGSKVDKWYSKWQAKVRGQSDRQRSEETTWRRQHWPHLVQLEHQNMQSWWMDCDLNKLKLMIS